jgi:hypothetical protein
MEEMGRSKCESKNKGSEKRKRIEEDGRVGGDRQRNWRV